MSRHETKAGSLEIAIGWDPPLQTYYGIIYDRSRDPEEEQIVKWVGTHLRELYEIEDLRNAMSDTTWPRAFVVSRQFIDKMGATLYGDKDEGR